MSEVILLGVLWRAEIGNRHWELDEEAMLVAPILCYHSQYTLYLWGVFMIAPNAHGTETMVVRNDACCHVPCWHASRVYRRVGALDTRAART